MKQISINVVKKRKDNNIGIQQATRDFERRQRLILLAVVLFYYNSHYLI